MDRDTETDRQTDRLTERERERERERDRQREREKERDREVHTRRICIVGQYVCSWRGHSLVDIDMDE